MYYGNLKPENRYDVQAGLLMLLLKQCSPSKHTDIMSVCSANRCPKTIVIIITHYNTFLRFQQWMVYNRRDATQSYIYKQDSLTDLSTLLITEEKSVLKN